MNTETNKIRFLPIGDSYTIGEGAKEEEAWPVLLCKHLNESGVKIDLIANPSRTAWTSQMAIDMELPVFEKLKPDFATLLIGVNDWVQQVPAEKFHENLKILLDRMQSVLSKKDHLILITIPDFSAAPEGSKYAHGRDISKGILEFNTIIINEARQRKLNLVDVYLISQQMSHDKELVATDGLHPSAKEYALWEKLIYPAAFDLLKEVRK